MDIFIGAREASVLTTREFQELSESRIILLDGATGSCLRAAGMPVGVSSEVWILEHPETLIELQRGYVGAGSDVIYAPTFMANRIGLSAHGLENRLEEMNRRLVALSKEASGGRALVAGDVTTTGRPLEPVGSMTYAELDAIYREQISVLADAGVDLLAVETMLSIEETTVALEAAKAVCDLPVLCSLTMESDGHLLFGGTAREAVETLSALGASAVGLNCSVGPDQLEAVVSELCASATVPVLVKPNAGLPVIDAQGHAHYSMSPDEFAAAMRRLVECGARVVGGCCGTNPDYIHALKAALETTK